MKAPAGELCAGSAVDVDPADWNQLIEDRDTLVLDTRNDFEIRVGSFQGSVNPGLHDFSHFTDWADTHLDPSRNKSVAMFCTGGIRCEKAGAYLKSKGFQNVYQLKGGILKYLEEMPQEDSLWHGECFVFDERVALTHGLGQGSYVSCGGCRTPLSSEEQASPLHEPGVSCSHCRPAMSIERLETLRRRAAQFNET